MAIINLDLIIDEIKSFEKILRGQLLHVFQMFGVPQYWHLIYGNELTKASIDKLLEKVNSEKIDKSQFFQLLNSATGDEYIALCCWIIKEITEKGVSGNNIFAILIGYSGGSETDEKNRRYQESIVNTIIEPITHYLIRELTESKNKIKLLKRYQILCEDYDHETIKDQPEVPLTTKHLREFLFREGIDHVYCETNVTNGRIDVFSEKESIVVEAKIFDGNINPIYEVISQAISRTMSTKINEVYAVIYNKTEELFEIEKDGDIMEIPFWNIGGVKVFIVPIYLNEEVLKKDKKWKGAKIRKLEKKDFIEYRSKQTASTQKATHKTTSPSPPRP